MFNFTLGEICVCICGFKKWLKITKERGGGGWGNWSMGDLSAFALISMVVLVINASCPLWLYIYIPKKYIRY